jgi:hypothetical protein
VRRPSGDHHPGVALATRLKNSRQPGEIDGSGESFFGCENVNKSLETTPCDAARLSVAPMMDGAEGFRAALFYWSKP